jgi:hypothetical protein
MYLPMVVEQNLTWEDDDKAHTRQQFLENRSGFYEN